MTARTLESVVGLTGGVGVGKSTAAAILAELGAVVVDCDQLGRLVAEPGGSAHTALVERFGPSIVSGDGSLDRAALAGIVFNDAAALADLNAITHPAIDAEIADRIAAAPAGATVVLDMAVLVESDLGAGRYGPVLVIEAPLDQRLERLGRYRGMTPDDARARIASQATDDERRAVADHVIINDSDVDALRADLERWWTGRPTGPDGDARRDRSSPEE
ncbi:MAG: dephospho-CoA kinase [Acidimicrobiales bacterium]